MRLRTICLISTLVLGLLVGLLTIEAQQAGKMPRIGYLRRSASPGGSDEAFRQALRDLGWIEGQSIAIEYRWAAGKFHRLPALAEELVRLKVDLIVTAGRAVTQAAKNATSTGQNKRAFYSLNFLPGIPFSPRPFNTDLIHKARGVPILRNCRRLK